MRESNISPLPSMSLQDRTLADYKGTGMTVGPHLMQYLRAALDAQGVLRTRDLSQAAQRQLGEDWPGWSSSASARARRRASASSPSKTRPASATPSSRPTSSSAIARTIHTASLLLVEGPLQLVDDVIHVRARRFHAAALPRQADHADRLRLPHARHAGRGDPGAAQVARLSMMSRHRCRRRPVGAVPASGASARS